MSMTRAVLWIAILVGPGCSRKHNDEMSTPSGSHPASTSTPSTRSTPSTSSAAEPGSASADAAVATVTGFAPFDDALAGRKPWRADDDVLGIIELVASDYLGNLPSGRSRGQYTVELRCGDAAASTVKNTGEAIIERQHDGDHNWLKCIDDDKHAARKRCIQLGIDESDLAREIDYSRVGDTWRVIGVKAYAMDAGMDKVEARFEQLLTVACK